MYLKRLELKGFKSFADKCVITLEPGISAIVGPNGSGKSNISDSILWVLGERNAKSLRGGVMEDVIFAGSSKRGAVSVAEVTLVLDNSDGVLPIEYNEVSISRRLYRTGESEYLINGVTARRLDVLDVLHDSGIGTDTNSIISQGHLDSILQSKPADRRTLIEEAAGVLKHKQRKIRSSRKLERMNFNMQRIGDVMAEIERQLKPLRIKAKRAAAYDGLMEELSELTLEIAVDDLKNIKGKWDKVDNERKELQVSVESKKAEFEKSEEELSNLRKKIASQNSDIVEYSSKQRQLNSYIDKLSGSAMLLDQKSQNEKEKYESYVDVASNDKDVSPEKQQILNNISEIKSSLENVQARLDEENLKSETAKTDSEESKEKLENLKSQYSEKSALLKDVQKQLSDNRTIVNQASENMLKYQEEIASAKTKIEDLNNKIKKNSEEIKSCEKSKSEKETLYKKLNDQHEKNVKKLNEINDKFSEKQNLVKSLNDELNELNSHIMATEKIIEVSLNELSDSYKWFDKNKSKFKNVCNFSDSVKVSEKYLGLLEKLLGGYSSSFIVEDSEISTINNDLKSSNESKGSLRIVSNKESKFVNRSCEEAKKLSEKFNGVCLSDEVKLNNKAFSVVSNVVAFDKFEDALSASKESIGVVCASLDGSVIYPDGRYDFCDSFVSESDENPGSKSIIGYKKNLQKMIKEQTKLNGKIESATKDFDKIKEDLNNLNEQESDLKNNLASSKAEFEFAVKYYNELNEALESNKQDLDIAKKDFDELKSKYSIDTPDIDNAKKKVSEFTKQVEVLNNEISDLQETVDKSRADYEDKKQNYNTSLVNLTALKERLKSHQENLNKANESLIKQEKIEKDNIEELQISKVKFKAYADLAAVIARLSSLAKKDLSNLDKNFGSINKEAKEVQKLSDDAINASNLARSSYDKENAKLNEVQVELGRLEVQVQNAVDAIDRIDGISVDKALEMPDIEDRDEKLDRQFKIRRRIANMGIINPDAKQEYEILKERYDFLSDQIEDLRAAKISLAKIDRIIDERMKDDFINTFDEVNKNFQKIFGVLFPGGKARLELELPDDVENSGVEVKAQPHGKHVSKMSLLSGGEKSLVALCLLFAVYKKRSTPFYILDEVEAALDDTNLRRLIKYLENLRNDTQLIMITHQRRTMEMSDVLYGVSMKNDGVTRVVSQRLEKDDKLHNIDK